MTEAILEGQTTILLVPPGARPRRKAPVRSAHSPTQRRLGRSSPTVHTATLPDGSSDDRPQADPGPSSTRSHSLHSGYRAMSTQPLEPGRVIGTGPFPVFGQRLRELGIECYAEPQDTCYSLVEVDGSLELRPPGEWDRPGIRAIFPPDRDPRRTVARSALSRAFGKQVTRVLDLTAGFGADAYRLAAAGYRVRAWERHPAIHALAAAGWLAAVRAGRTEPVAATRLEFIWGDGVEAKDEMQGATVGAYFDPMYPPSKRRSALRKRPLRVLRELLGAEESPIPLVEAACERLPRVVVKRPHRAPPLVEGASHSLESKLVRFDVYLNPARMRAKER